MMKRLMLCVGLLFSLNLFSQETGIQFEHDLSIKEVCAKAKAANKFIFVDCYTTWCGPCKKLSAEVFPKEEVGTYFNAKFINVKIDMEKSEGKNYHKRYNIQGYPTLLVLNSDGEILNILGGYISSDQLLMGAKNTLSNPETLAETKRKIANGDRSKDAIIKVIEAESTYDKPHEFSQLADEYFLTLSEEERLSEDAWSFFFSYQTNIYSKQFQYFISNKSKFEEVYGDEEVKNKITDTFYAYTGGLEEGSKEYNDLKNIDESLFAAYLLQTALNESYMKFMAKSKNEVAWNTFIGKVTLYANSEAASVGTLNQFCWVIWENFKTFNDLETVKKAVKWSYRTVQADPDEHLYNDTYAHLCFEIGEVEEAIKYQEIAIKYAIRDNDEVANWYVEEVERFKKEL